MDERQWRIFKTVAEERSFSRAARRLHLSQPAVSAQIKWMEESLGTVLLERTTHRVALTPAGRALLAFADEALALDARMREAVRSAAGSLAGRLLLAGSFTIGEYLLPPVLGHFRTLYPGVDVRLSIANTEQVSEWVVRQDVDLGLVEAPVSRPELEASTFYADELGLIVPSSHPWAGRQSVSPAELAGQPLVLREPGSGTRRVVEDFLYRSGLTPEDLHVVYEFGSGEAVKAAVEFGLGIAIVSKLSLKKELRLGNVDPSATQLVYLGWKDVTFRRSFYTLTRRGRQPGQAGAALLTLLQSSRLEHLLT